MTPPLSVPQHPNPTLNTPLPTLSHRDPGFGVPAAASGTANSQPQLRPEPGKPGSQSPQEWIWMAWVTALWQTGQAGASRAQILVAQGRQKRLWPQGTRAAVASLSKQMTQSCLRRHSGGELDVEPPLDEE